MYKCLDIVSLKILLQRIAMATKDREKMVNVVFIGKMSGQRNIIMFKKLIILGCNNLPMPIIRVKFFLFLHEV